MTTTTDRGALEALLFVSDEPVSTAELGRILDRSAAQIEDLLTELAQDYVSDERGFQLREVAGGWRLYTHPAYSDLIEAYVLSWDTRRLSQAALEALAVIAYHQPVTRGGVNAIRGVNSEAVISSLIEKGLVREAGRDKAQGNAILYATTRSFLEKFGLKDLSGLPALEDFAPDEEAQESIRLRLGAGASTADVLNEDEDDELIYGRADGSEPQRPFKREHTDRKGGIKRPVPPEVPPMRNKDLAEELSRDVDIDITDELEDVEELD